MNTVLSKALREFITGPLNQLIVNLGGQDGDQWEQQLKRFLRKEPCWRNGEVAQAPTPKSLTNLLLDHISMVVITATTAKFVAKEKFLINTNRDAPVKISFLSDNFTEWYLSGNGKIEDPMDIQTLCCAKLRKASADVTIIAELGGEEKSETTLSEMFYLMENDKDIILSDSCCFKIFYIPDKNGVLRAVGVFWDGAGWYVFAHSLIKDPDKWDSGHLIFYRNPVL